MQVSCASWPACCVHQDVVLHVSLVPSALHQSEGRSRLSTILYGILLILRLTLQLVFPLEFDAAAAVCPGALDPTSKLLTAFLWCPSAGSPPSWVTLWKWCLLLSAAGLSVRHI